MYKRMFLKLLIHTLAFLETEHLRQEARHSSDASGCRVAIGLNPLQLLHFYVWRLSESSLQPLNKLKIVAMTVFCTLNLGNP